MTKREVAQLMRVSTRTIERYRARGRLRAIKLSPGQQGRIVYSREDVIAFLAARAD